jgi:NAD-dependent DNA ligase
MDLYNEFEDSRYFNVARMDRRAADALAGLAMGLVADGVVNQSEAYFLKGWLEGNVVHLEDPVINLLYQRLGSMLHDGVLDKEESADLLQGFGGVELVKGVKNTFARPNDLPCDDPPPDLVSNGRVIVFTGIMAYGPRAICKQLAEEKGALVAGSVSRKTDYLVIGTVGNEQWRHSSYGLKIMKAVELRESGVGIAIVDEDWWLKSILA